MAPSGDTPSDLTGDLSKEDRVALLSRMREEAAAVAEVGFWPAPKGFYLYWAVNTVNWKIYIGATNNFQARVADHKNLAAQGGLLPLHRAIRKYGAHAFVFVPIEPFADEAAMGQAERQAIADYQTQDREIGYNLADGGPGIGIKGAREVHARPEFRAKFLASYPARAVKAAETRRRNLALRAKQAALNGLLPDAD
jgi:predicted GIY-YIG superfamily endonuclease